MKRIRPLVIAVLLVAMGCATVRLEYRADVKLANGNEAEVTYARSYDTSGHMIACIITGLFYGGWCWAYTVMPFASQDAELTRDAERFLQSEFGKKFSVAQTRIIKRGYSNLPLEKDVVYLDEEGEEEEEEEVVETKTQKKERKKREARDAAERDRREKRWQEYQSSTRQFSLGLFEHYAALEGHFTGVGFVYGKSLGKNRHLNINYFSSSPDTFFFDSDTKLTDLEATLRFHANAFYIRLGVGYRRVEFESNDDPYDGYYSVGDDKLFPRGSVSTLGGVGAVGIDVTDGDFFYGMEFLRIYSPWSTLDTDISFRRREESTDAVRQKFKDRAANAESGDFLKVKVGFILH